jgi:hypothetical protein
MNARLRQKIVVDGEPHPRRRTGGQIRLSRELSVGNGVDERRVEPDGDDALVAEIFCRVGRWEALCPCRA